MTRKSDIVSIKRGQSDDYKSMPVARWVCQNDSSYDAILCVAGRSVVKCLTVRVCL